MMAKGLHALIEISGAGFDLQQTPADPAGNRRVAQDQVQRTFPILQVIAESFCDHIQVGRKGFRGV